MVPPPPPCEFEYAVFISYRHLDNQDAGRQWATWLHTALERYEVPPDLAGTTNVRGVPVSPSLYPVFRDEEELSADNDLSKKLKRALERSRMLVVLCSPRAVKSKFVCDEIRYFKELGRSDSIFALLIDGEPNVTDSAGNVKEGFSADMECLPHPLRFGAPAADGTIDWEAPSDPIAADARPGKRPEQGWTTPGAHSAALVNSGVPRGKAAELALAYGRELQTALLWIIAGALGVNLRELTKRSEAYKLRLANQRVRRLGRLALAFAVLTLLAVSGGLYSWKKKRDEAIQRATAEELLGFMLFDLRDKLQPMGRTDILSSVTESANRYFKSFPAEESNIQTQRQRAKLISNIGEIQYDQSKLKEADGSYHTALQMRRKLMALDFKSPEARQDLWDILGKLGRLRVKQGNLSEAEAYLREARWLAEMEKGETAQANTAVTLDSLAGVLRLEGKTEEARKVYEEALGLREMRMKQPGDLREAMRDLSVSQNHLGEIAVEINDLPKAVEYFEASRKIREYLAAVDESNAQARMDFSASLGKLGGVEQKRGNLSEAENAYRQALEIRKRLAEKDPFSSRAQSQVATAYHRLGDVQVLQKRYTDAGASLKEALKIRRHLSDIDSSDADAKRVYCYTLDSLGKIQALEGLLLEAETSHRKSLEITRGLAAADPKNADAQRNLAVSYNRVSAIELAQKRFGDAEKSIRESLNITERLAARNTLNADMQSYYCESLEGLMAVQMAVGDWEKCGQSSSKALAVREKLATSPTSGDDTRRDFALCLNTTARLMLAKKDPRAAIGFFNRSRDVLGKIFTKRPGDSIAFQEYHEVLQETAELAEAQGWWPEALECRSESWAVIQKSRKDGNQALSGLPGKQEAGSAGSKLAFALIMSRNFTGAVEMARATLAESGGAEGEATLAHALLLDNQWNEALGIYLTGPADLQEKRLALVEEDFRKFEAAGIFHPDMAKVREAIRTKAGE